MPRHRQRRARNVGGANRSACFKSNGNRDGSRTGTHVQNANVAARAYCRHRRLYQMLGLGAGNQHVRSNPELPPVELLSLGDVLGWLALQPFVEIAPVVDPGDLCEFVRAMRIQVCPLTSHGVA